MRSRPPLAQQITKSSAKWSDLEIAQEQSAKSSSYDEVTQFDQKNIRSNVINNGQSTSRNESLQIIESTVKTDNLSKVRQSQSQEKSESMLADFSAIKQIEDPIPSKPSSEKKITSPKFGFDEEQKDLKEPEEPKQF